MNLHIGMAWRIRCCSSRCRIFSEPLKNSQLMDHIRDRSPNHRPSSQGSSDCGRSVSIGHLLLTISSPSSRSWSQRSPPCQPLAQCFCLPSRCRHLSCVVPLIDLRHGRRRWRSRWSLAVHWDQSSRPIRRTEAKDYACDEALILEAEGAVCSCGDLLKLQLLRLPKKDEHPARENTKASGVSFFTQKTNVGRVFSDDLIIANSLPKTRHFAWQERELWRGAFNVYYHFLKILWDNLKKWNAGITSL